MPGAPGGSPKARLAILAALATLALLPAGAASLDLSVDAPVVGPQTVNVDAAGDLVDVDAASPLLPKAKLDLPLLDVEAGPQEDSPRTSPAAAPAPTPPTPGQRAAEAAAQARDAAIVSAVAMAPVLPWEAAWASASKWAAQTRETLRPILRPIGRALRALPFLLPLFSRVGSDRLLENPVRARVHEAIAQDPGLSVQDLRDRAGIAWGTTVHHLARLERHGLVVSVRHGNHRRFFPANTEAARRRRELTTLSHPTAHRVASHVQANPGTDQKSLCVALGLQNPAASKHLSRLERLGLVSSEQVGRSRLYAPTEALAAVLGTFASLGGVQPEGRIPPRVPLRDLPEASRSPDIAVAT